MVILFHTTLSAYSNSKPKSPNNNLRRNEITLTHLSQREKKLPTQIVNGVRGVDGCRGWKGVIEVILPQRDVTLVNLISHAGKCKICS